MARKKSETTIDGMALAPVPEAIAQDMSASHAMVAEDLTRHDAALRMAEQIGYEGGITVAALTATLRLRMRRTVEEVIEIGRATLLLKLQLDHGQFGQALAEIGLERSLANRFMQAAAKFAAGGGRIAAIPGMTQTKLLELLILDDASVAELAETGTVPGLPADAIECMSVSELRSALRDARAVVEDKDGRIKTVQAENETLREEKAKRTRYTPDVAAKEAGERRAQRMAALQAASLAAMTAINEFGIVLADVSADADDRDQAMATARWLAQQISNLYVAHQIDVDFAETITPTWTRGE